MQLMDLSHESRSCAHKKLEHHLNLVLQNVKLHPYALCGKISGSVLLFYKTPHIFFFSWNSYDDNTSSEEG